MHVDMGAHRFVGRMWRVTFILFFHSCDQISDTSLALAIRHQHLQSWAGDEHLSRDHVAHVRLGASQPSPNIAKTVEVVQRPTHLPALTDRP